MDIESGSDLIRANIRRKTRFCDDKPLGIGVGLDRPIPSVGIHDPIGGVVCRKKRRGRRTIPLGGVGGKTRIRTISGGSVSLAISLGHIDQSLDFGDCCGYTGAALERLIAEHGRPHENGDHQENHHDFRRRES